MLAQHLCVHKLKTIKEEASNQWSFLHMYPCEIVYLYIYIGPQKWGH